MPLCDRQSAATDYKPKWRGNDASSSRGLKTNVSKNQDILSRPYVLPISLSTYLTPSAYAWETQSSVYLPRYFHDLIRLPSSAISLRPLRSLDRHDLFVPRVTTSMAKTRAFASQDRLSYITVANGR